MSRKETPAVEASTIWTCDICGAKETTPVETTPVWTTLHTEAGEVHVCEGCVPELLDQTARAIRKRGGGG